VTLIKIKTLTPEAIEESFPEIPGLYMFQVGIGNVTHRFPLDEDDRKEHAAKLCAEWQNLIVKRQQLKEAA
jgi:hypothetical protein